MITHSKQRVENSLATLSKFSFSKIDVFLKLRVYEPVQNLFIPVFTLFFAHTPNGLQMDHVLFILALFMKILSSYCINDYSDWQSDIRNPRLNLNSTRSQSYVMRVFFISATLSLLLAFLVSQKAFTYMLALHVISLAYSTEPIHLKTRILWPQLAHFACGFLYSYSVIDLVGIYGTNTYYLPLALGLALASGSFFNECLDESTDKFNNFCKIFGKNKTLILANSLQVLALIALVYINYLTFGKWALFFIVFIVINVFIFQIHDLLKVQKLYRLLFAAFLILSLVFKWIFAN